MHLSLKNGLCTLSAEYLALFQTLAPLLHLALVFVGCHECVRSLLVLLSQTFKHQGWEPPGLLLADEARNCAPLSI